MDNYIKPKFIFWLVVGVGVGVVSSCLFYRFSIHRLNFSSGKIDHTVADFVIRPGEKVYEVAAHLREEKLINSSTLFKIYVKLGRRANKLQAGSYKIPRDLSLVQVTDRLQHGTFDLRLTFPEGWRREEMSQYISQSFANQTSRFDVREFLDQSRALEGYLFPDTYVVPFDFKSSDLIRLMRRTFDQKVGDKLRSDLGRANLTLEQAVILASIVEREARSEQERPIIAGILLKRFQSGWPLEADATVQYAVASQIGAGVRNWWPKTLSAADLQIDSPFNTRKVAGLPPAPICNPGLAAIQAVVYPIETPYWFYLSDAKGVAHYAKTLTEHEGNIAKFLP